jgi:hypothetical protein
MPVKKVIMAAPAILPAALGVFAMAEGMSKINERSHPQLE